VAEILTPLQRWWTIPATGWSHLVVAFVLTIGSWIGYHTSANRPRYSIKFVNLPFAQFVLDIAMVIAYWLTAATAPLPEHSTLRDLPAPTASAVPESVLVLAAFVLYVLWDRVSKIMQSKDYYINAQSKPWAPGRRKITVMCALGACLIAAVAGYANHNWRGQRSWVIGLDVALILLLVGYRAAKEIWRLYYKNRKLDPPAVSASLPPPPSPKPLDIIGRLESIERKIDGLTNPLERPS
jgi:hypothetical protein